MKRLRNQFLPIAMRWGGEPAEGWWRGNGGAYDPSTMLRMVPLPTGFAGREEF